MTYLEVLIQICLSFVSYVSRFRIYVGVFVPVVVSIVCFREMDYWDWVNAEAAAQQRYLEEFPFAQFPEVDYEFEFDEEFEFPVDDVFADGEEDPRPDDWIGTTFCQICQSEDHNYYHCRIYTGYDSGRLSQT